ncbi:MAG: response regulator [Chitinophagales bacterium]|nr:response regulator [Chitinophagales bacterium]
MKNVHILLVEDNEGDIVLTTEAFEESKILNKFSVVRNGKEALDFLYKTGNYQDAPDPDIILLDINLPLMSGIEVLQEIKNDDRVKHIPVIMLTTSSSEKDITLSYKHHANCYITKPVEIAKFLDAITAIEHFWLEIVSLDVKRK